MVLQQLNLRRGTQKVGNPKGEQRVEGSRKNNGEEVEGGRKNNTRERQKAR